MVTFRRLLRFLAPHRAGVIGAFVLCALLANVLSPADPEEQSLRQRFTPPVWEQRGTWTHVLGTDRLGRDLLSRIIWGSRVSLTAGVLTVLLASAFGAGVGLVAGYHGGRVDAALMRITDATMSFPVILLALILEPDHDFQQAFHVRAGGFHQSFQIVHDNLDLPFERQIGKWRHRRAVGLRDLSDSARAIWIRGFNIRRSCS